MAEYEFDMGIIGGGAAGLTVAAGAAQLGAKALLIEKEKNLGGDCLHFGCVPSKTLIRSAHVYHLMRNAARFGLPGVDLPPVDFKAVRDRIRSVILTIQEHDSEERFCRLGVKVVLGDPRFTDPHAVRVNGHVFTAKNWVVSTGSSPAVPPIPDLAQTPFITNKDLFSLDHLPSSMIILGAGPIAAEMAQAFGRLGSAVTVVQRSSQILSREDRDMADQVLAVLQSEGVVFHLNTAVLRTKDLGDEREVVIRSGSGEERSLRAETLLVALGRKPNLDHLGLEEIGVYSDGKGIKVNGRMQSSQKHLFAAGDVTGQYLFTHAAGYEGGIIVSNALFHLPRKADYTLLPWCTYTDPELAGIGMNEKEALAAGIEPRVWTEPFQANDRSLAEEQRVGQIKMILDEKEKPIGVQILGPRAGDLLGEWVAVLNGRVKLSTLAASVHPYPTLGEINKRVAGNYFSPKIFSDRIKKGLKFFFHLKGRACEPPRGGEAVHAE